MNKIIVWAVGLSCLACVANGQDPNIAPANPWIMQDSGTEESFRGLHVLSSQVAWASGTGGTVIRTTDGGRTWGVSKVPDSAELDFRDIHAFNVDTAVIISAGAPARIYRTTDGAKTWTKAFEHASDKAFFDAMSFWDETHGIAMSDPIDDRVLLITTADGGKTWAELPPANRPRVIPGEGGFAASGTNMRVIADQRVLIALGSAKQDESFKTSRIVWSDDRGTTWHVAKVPMPRSPSSGIFAMCFADEKHGVVVGGDYLEPENANSTAAITSDGGITWRASARGPRGYRSGLAVRRVGDRFQWIAVGTTGTDVSNDFGDHWEKLSDEAFHAVQFTADGHGWATGAKGRVAKWNRPTE